MCSFVWQVASEVCELWLECHRPSLAPCCAVAFLGLRTYMKSLLCYNFRTRAASHVIAILAPQWMGTGFIHFGLCACSKSSSRRQERAPKFCPFPPHLSDARSPHFPPPPPPPPFRPPSDLSRPFAYFSLLRSQPMRAMNCAPATPTPGFGFRVSGFEFRVSGFGFRV